MTYSALAGNIQFRGLGASTHFVSEEISVLICHLKEP